jgi:hypothetical protein
MYPPADGRALFLLTVSWLARDSVGVGKLYVYVYNLEHCYIRMNSYKENWRCLEKLAVWYRPFGRVVECRA